MNKNLVLLFTSDFSELPLSVQEEIYNEFYQMVYPMIQFIVRDHGAAQDIIQESFLRAIEKAPQLQDINCVEAWLKTLTRNLCFNYLRKFKRNRDELEPIMSLINRDGALSPSSRGPEEEVESRMLEEAIAQYMDQLKPDYKQVLEMRWIQRLSYRDMADAMHATEGVVRQKLFRAREAIKERLQTDWGIE